MAIKSEGLLSREQLSLLGVSLSLFAVLLVAAVFIDFFLQSVVFGHPRVASSQYTREATVPLKIDQELDFLMYSQSPDTSSHQGIARDQKHYYTFDTDAIYKFNLDWQKVSSSKK